MNSSYKVGWEINNHEKRSSQYPSNILPSHLHERIATGGKKCKNCDQLEKEQEEWLGDKRSYIVELSNYADDNKSLKRKLIEIEKKLNDTNEELLQLKKVNDELKVLEEEWVKERGLLMEELESKSQAIVRFLDKQVKWKKYCHAKTMNKIFQANHKANNIMNQLSMVHLDFVQEFREGLEVCKKCSAEKQQYENQIKIHQNNELNQTFITTQLKNKIDELKHLLDSSQKELKDFKKAKECNQEYIKPCKKRNRENKKQSKEKGQEDIKLSKKEKELLFPPTPETPSCNAKEDDSRSVWSEESCDGSSETNLTCLKIISKTPESKPKKLEENVPRNKYYYQSEKDHNSKVQLETKNISNIELNPHVKTKNSVANSFTTKNEKKKSHDSISEGTNTGNNFENISAPEISISKPISNSEESICFAYVGPTPSKNVSLTENPVCRKSGRPRKKRQSNDLNGVETPGNRCSVQESFDNHLSCRSNSPTKDKLKHVDPFKVVCSNQDDLLENFRANNVILKSSVAKEMVDKSSSFVAKMQNTETERPVSLQELQLNKSNKRTSETSLVSKKKVKLTESNSSHYQFGRNPEVKSLISSEGWSPPQDLSRDFEPILRQLSTIPEMISPLRLDSEDSQTSTVKHNDFNDFHSVDLKHKKTSLFSPIYNHSIQCETKDVTEEFENSVDLSFDLDKVSSERSTGTQSGPELDKANSLSLDIISPIKSSTKERPNILLKHNETELNQNSYEDSRQSEDSYIKGRKSFNNKAENDENRYWNGKYSHKFSSPKKSDMSLLIPEEKVKSKVKTKESDIDKGKFEELTEKNQVIMLEKHEAQMSSVTAHSPDTPPKKSTKNYDSHKNKCKKLSREVRDLMNASGLSLDHCKDDEYLSPRSPTAMSCYGLRKSPKVPKNLQYSTVFPKKKGSKSANSSQQPSHNIVKRITSSKKKVNNSQKNLRKQDAVPYIGKRIFDQSKDKNEIIQTPVSPQSMEYKNTELDIPLQKEPLKFKRSPVIPNIASDHTGTLSEIEIQSSMDDPEPLEVKLKLTCEERLNKLKKEDCLVNPVKIDIFGRHASDISVTDQSILKTSIVDKISISSNTPASNINKGKDSKIENLANNDFINSDDSFEKGSLNKPSTNTYSLLYQTARCSANNIIQITDKTTGKTIETTIGKLNVLLSKETKDSFLEKHLQESFSKRYTDNNIDVAPNQKCETTISEEELFSKYEPLKFSYHSKLLTTASLRGKQKKVEIINSEEIPAKKMRLMKDIVKREVCKPYHSTKDSLKKITEESNSLNNTVSKNLVDKIPITSEKNSQHGVLVYNSSSPRKCGRRPAVDEFENSIEGSLEPLTGKFHSLNNDDPKQLVEEPQITCKKSSKQGGLVDRVYSPTSIDGCKQVVGESCHVIKNKLKNDIVAFHPLNKNISKSIICGAIPTSKLRPRQTSDELSSSSQNDTKPIMRESCSVSEIDCNSFKKKRRLKPDIRDNFKHPASKSYSTMINCRSQCDTSKLHPTSNFDSKNVIDEPNVDVNKPNTSEALLSQDCNISTLNKMEKNPMTNGINNLNQLADKEDDNKDDSDCLVIDIDEDYLETEEADMNLSVKENTVSYAPEYNTESINLDSKRRKLNLNSMNNPATSSKTNKKLEFFDEKSQTSTKIVTVTPPFIVPQYQLMCKYDNNLVKNNTNFSAPENCVPPFEQNATCSKMQNPKKPPVSETYLPKFYTDPNDSENHTSETPDEKQESVKEKHLDMNLSYDNMSKLQSLEELIPKGKKTVVKENVLRTVIMKRNEEQEYYKKRNILEGRIIDNQVPADITKKVMEIVTPLVNEDLKSVTDIVEIADKIKEYNIRVILKAVMVLIHNKTSEAPIGSPWLSWDIPQLPNKKSPIVHPRVQAIFLLIHMVIDGFTKDKNEEERRKFVEEELFFIEQTFYGNSELPDNLPMFWYTLGFLYTLLARKFGFLVRVRQLMYDMLYCFTKRALTVAFAMIKVWPLVLPVKPIKHYANDPLALSVILYLTTAPPEYSQHKKTQHMVAQLHKLLKRKYRFQADTVKADDLFDLCLTHLGHPGVHEALVLLAKRQRGPWFTGRPLQQLIDVVEGWWKGGEECSDVRAVAAINAISSSLRPCKESEVRDGLQKVYSLFTGIICDPNTPSWMQEVVVRNTCCVARLNLSLCLELISSWRPTEISQEVIDQILIEVIQRHPPQWWSSNKIGRYHLCVT